MGCARTMPASPSGCANVASPVASRWRTSSLAQTTSKRHCASALSVQADVDAATSDLTERSPAPRDFSRALDRLATNSTERDQMVLLMSRLSKHRELLSKLTAPERSKAGVGRTTGAPALIDSCHGKQASTATTGTRIRKASHFAAGLALSLLQAGVDAVLRSCMCRRHWQTLIQCPSRRQLMIGASGTVMTRLT